MAQPRDIVVAHASYRHTPEADILTLVTRDGVAYILDRPTGAPTADLITDTGIQPIAAHHLTDEGLLLTLTPQATQEHRLPDRPLNLLMNHHTLPVVADHLNDLLPPTAGQ